MTSLVLLAIAFFFKWVDTFILRLDERLGEIILCKTLGFVLVIVFVWAAGQSLRDIGLHARRLGASLLIGTIAAVVTLAVSYAAGFIMLLPSEPVLTFAAIDPKAGVSGGLLFALWMILGNVVNSFMEEGLFRGVMGRLFRIRLSFWGANALQAFLFALWHLPWVLKWYQTGQLEEHGGLVFATLTQFLPMLSVGFAWGYFLSKDRQPVGALGCSPSQQHHLQPAACNHGRGPGQWPRNSGTCLHGRHIVDHVPGQVPGRALPNARGQALGPMGR